ncbi:winged helix-turn-helix domain-containing protein [Rhodoligotrophos defluvii]|uniref:winged helix-turn-helix domain-containing protein n=1 Tax=Rhodoligotrophos defluvii TaxID=2561934 RepID=UPI0010C9D81E|nr:LysR family transcriptional regulator [Rhodoligotrophos defluvii]
MSDPAPKLWIKIRLAGGEIGPGKITLLKRVAEHHSIAAAARSMGMSYRRAWLLLDEINKICGESLVETFSGGHARGGARLTPLGEKVVVLFDRASDQAEAGAAEAMAALRQLLSSKGG